MINNVVSLLSATNKETPYEQLVQPAGERKGRHKPNFPFFLACVETSPMSHAENVCTQSTLSLSLSQGLLSPSRQAALA